MIFFRGRLQRSKNFFRGDRQIHDPHAHGVIDGVCDGRRHLGDRAFPDFFALKRGCPILPAHERGLQRHKILYVRYFVFAQVGRHDSAVFHHHLFHQSVAHALHNAAVDLPLVPHWIQNRRNVMNGVQLAQMDLTGLNVDMDFSDAGGEHSLGRCFGGLEVAFHLEAPAFGCLSRSNLRQR